MSKLVKALASTHEETRDEAIESLDHYITLNITKLSTLDLQKLWKGIYYSVWLCDGGENQDKLTMQIGQMINKPEYRPTDWVKVNSTFWDIIIKEWEDIDQWRINKYLLLIRRVLKHNFKYLDSKKWNVKVIKLFNQVIAKPLSITRNYAIPYHLCDIYLDELEDYESVPEYILDRFKRAKKDSKLKTFREKISEDVLDDARAKKRWYPEEKKEEEDEDEEDEWKGF